MHTKFMVITPGKKEIFATRYLAKNYLKQYGKQGSVINIQSLAETFSEITDRADVINNADQEDIEYMLKVCKNLLSRYNDPRDKLGKKRKTDWYKWSVEVTRLKSFIKKYDPIVKMLNGGNNG